MADCENCDYRKYMAMAFDMHWMGKDDCPMIERCDEVSKIKKEDK